MHNMSFEVESQITGKLIKNTVKVLDQSIQNELLAKGYGERYDDEFILNSFEALYLLYTNCLLYTSPSPRDQRGSRMPSSA